MSEVRARAKRCRCSVVYTFGVYNLGSVNPVVRARRGGRRSPAKEEGVIKIKIKLNIMPFVRSPGLHLVIWVSNSVKLAAERSLRFRKSCAKREGADWLKYVKVVNF